MLVIGLVAVMLLFWHAHSATTTAARPSGAKPDPANGSVLVGSVDAATTLDIFNEPICPACGRFIMTYSTDFERLTAGGRFAVRYHLLNFLDPESASGDYSTRAVAASHCVAVGEDATGYARFYAAMFAPGFQPEEGGRRDRSDDELASLARRSGASDATVSCIRSGEFATLAKTQAKQAYSDMTSLGGRGTPAVFRGRSEVTVKPHWLDAFS